MYENSRDSQENYQQLSESSSIEISEKVAESQDLGHPIARYNYFIEAYNKDINKINDISLEKMIFPKIINVFSRIKSNKVYYTTYLLIILLIPLLNVLLAGFLVYDFDIYRQNLKIFWKNKEKVPNPFEKMIYSPHICKTLKKENWFFNIELKSVPGFFLNFDMIEMIRSKERDGFVSFMIYNTVFQKYFYDYPIFYKKYVKQVVFAFFILFLNIAAFILCVFIILKKI